jgi:hypothetical protein
MTSNEQVLIIVAAPIIGTVMNVLAMQWGIARVRRAARR